jgi:uncharacterized protein YqjF (DUF2071 family)
MTTAVLPHERPGHDDEGPAAAPREVAWFLADWRDALFVHYTIDPDILQPHVRFDLDLHAGRAWVSLVAFTQVHLRPAVGGRLTALAMAPVATHAFLNLRTYVRAHGHAAICFLAEWIPNPLARWVGPALYGLPFRLARLDYTPDRRHVRTREGTCAFHTPADDREAGSLPDDFLLERYTALTAGKRRGRMFHIRHAPWTWQCVAASVTDDSLIRRAAPWFDDARLAGAHRSPGVFGVEIGGPRRVPLGRPASD